MKSALLFVFIIGILNIAFTQITDLDKVVEDYELRYRTVLIEEDFQLIENLLESVKEKGCQDLERALISDSYSNVFKRELTNKFLTSSVGCIKTIIDHIDLENPHPNSVRPYDLENFPILKAIYISPKHINKVCTFLLTSDFLDDCNFLREASRRKVNALARILKNEETNIWLSEQQQVLNCKAANVFLLVKMP